MDILMLAFIAIAPWIIGVAAIFNHFSRKKPLTDTEAIQKLQGQADRLKDPAKKEGFLLAIKCMLGQNMESEFLPEPQSQPILAPAASLHVAPMEGIGETIQASADQHIAAPPIEESPKTSEPRALVHKGIRSLDNINILLYIGSFLVVVSAGIFIGFNYQTLSGISKTIFLLIFTLIFYFAGLFLYLKTARMKPAGLTFATIGIILFPLCGLAYYKFLTNGSHGNTIWFITSILTLVFYAASIKYLKKVYLNYLATFVLLSIFESFVSLFDVPVYYFFWGLSIFALLASLVVKKSKALVEIEEPLRITSQILMPLSLFAGLFLTFNYGWMPVGVNLLFGSLFYALTSLLAINEESKATNFIASAVMLPLGLTAIAADQHFDAVYISAIWIAAALLYTILSGLFSGISSSARSNASNIISIICLFISAFINISQPIYPSISLVAAVLISGYAYFLNRQAINLILANLAFMLLPIIYLGHAYTPAFDHGILAAIYAVLATAYVLFLSRYRKSQKEVLGVALGSFVAAGIFGLSLAFSGGIYSLVLLVSIFFALLIMQLSKLFEDYRFDIFATLCLIVPALYSISEPLNLTYSLSAVVLLSSYFYFLHRKAFNLVSANLAFILLPYVYFSLALSVRLDTLVVSYLYTILASAYMLFVCYCRRMSPEAISISVFSFFTTGISALAFAYSAGSSYLILALGVLLALLVLMLSERFKNYKLDILSGFLIYLVSWQVIEVGNLKSLSFMWILSAIGLLFYLIGYMASANVPRSRLWKLMGLAGSYLSSLWAFSDYQHTDLQLAGSIALAGFLSYFDAYQNSKKFWKYISAAIIITALNFLLHYLKIEEQHVYTAIWAVYFGVLAYLQHRESQYQNRNTLAVIGMGLLTVPLFFQATQYDGQIYGIILGLESIILLLFGMHYRYKLATWWGTICLLIIVADQTKDAIFALPKWLIIGIVGLLFLGGATYLLSKNNPEKK